VALVPLKSCLCPLPAEPVLLPTPAGSTVRARLGGVHAQTRVSRLMEHDCAKSLGTKVHGEGQVATVMDSSVLPALPTQVSASLFTRAYSTVESMQQAARQSPR
jgi:hypothetical protein